MDCDGLVRFPCNPRRVTAGVPRGQCVARQAKSRGDRFHSVPGDLAPGRRWRLASAEAQAAVLACLYSPGGSP
jgi:hypothetical protein